MSQPEILKADYLVIGSGAMGMAFTDVIVAESKASVILVDRRDQPGGHWSDAYPFVRLHSASSYYGVNSRALGEDKIDDAGLNRGFHERASAAEICAYFDRIMRQQFLPSGRVQYFPSSDYRGDGRFVSLVSGVERRVVAKCIVDATFTDTDIPSRRPPPYAVARGVRCIAPNALPHAANAERYAVIGGGKTGMDVCSWLLERSVPAERITWVVPRDSWLLDRAHFEPGEVFWGQRMGALVKQMELIGEARSTEHLFELLHAHGQLLSIDERVTPSRYRCATVSRAELEQLRRIENVIRLGHVHHVEPQRIVLERGAVAMSEATLYIDCTSSGIRSRASVPVFDAGKITLQPVRTCQQCFSSALIAHVDLTGESDEQKNALCQPIRLPIAATDWLGMFAANLSNQYRWTSTPELRQWIAKSRLDINASRTSEFSPAERALMERFKTGAGPAVAKLSALLRLAA